MLQLTRERVPASIIPTRIFVTTTTACRALAQLQLPDLPADQFIVVAPDLETYPVVCCATAHIHKRFGCVAILVLASDHVIGSRTRFEEAVNSCLSACIQHPAIACLGVSPREASTRYGYMELGSVICGINGAFIGKAYREKPDLATAEGFVNGRSHDWNTGIFAWLSDVFLRAAWQLTPEHHAGMVAIIASTTPDQLTDAEQHLASAPSIDLDRGLLEKIPGSASGVHLIFIRGQFDWDDVGNFSSLSALSERDLKGNAVRGAGAAGVIAHDVSNSYIYCNNHLTIRLSDIDGALVVAAEGGDLLLALNENIQPLRTLQCHLARSRGRQGRYLLDDGRRWSIAASTEGLVITARSPVPPLSMAALPTVIFPDHPSLSAFAAHWVVGVLRDMLLYKDRVNVVFSAGVTPLEMYHCLQRSYLHAIDWRRVRHFQMDEYAGPLPDAFRFSTYLAQHLIEPLGMDPGSVYLNGSESNNEMFAYEKAIELAGGIDLIIHGLGVNGHIGFNEPGSTWDSESRRVDLAHCPAGFEPEPCPRQGVTMGLRQICRARETLVMATGGHKSAAVARMLREEASVDLPASVLLSTSAVTCFFDRSCWDGIEASYAARIRAASRA